MADQQPLARIFSLPNLPRLPDIELPVWLEHAERIADKNHDLIIVRKVAQAIFLIAGLFGLVVDVVGRLLFSRIASWPSLTVVWMPPIGIAGLLLIIIDRRLDSALLQFCGLAKLQQFLQLYRAILRYGELRAHYLECYSHPNDERCFGLRPAYEFLTGDCLPRAEQGQSFDSHLRLAVSCLDEAERAMW